MNSTNQLEQLQEWSEQFHRLLMVGKRSCMALRIAARIDEKLERSRHFVPKWQLAKRMGTAAFFLCLSFQAQAQDFSTPPEENPFGLEENALPVAEQGLPVLADMDGDGDLDLFLYNGYDGVVLYYQNSGTSNQADFSAAPINTPFGIQLPTGEDVEVASLAFADIDNDEDLDLFSIASTYSGEEESMRTLHYQENIGSPTNPQFGDVVVDNPFGLCLSTEVPGGYLTGVLTLADMDGDGDLDILRSGYDYHGEQGYNCFLVYDENRGTPSSPEFGSKRIIELGTQDVLMSQPVVGDLDMDGDLDVVSGWEGYNNHSFIFLENEGSYADMQFGTVVTTPFGATALVSGEGGLSAIFAMGDMDSDGDLDILGGIYDGDGPEFKVLYYQNGYTTPTQDLDKEHQLQLFPNPVREWLRISADTAIDAVEIWDALGRKAVEVVAPPNGAISVGQLPLGHYVAKVTVDGGLVNLPFVKR